MALQKLLQEITEYYNYYEECCEEAESTPIPQDEYIEKMCELLSHCIESQVHLISYEEV